MPETSAILLDVDGTLAPIVAHPDLTRVPSRTLEIVEDLAERYALVACVSGRQTREVARLVPVAGVQYIGNHGFERLVGDTLQWAEGAADWVPIVASTCQAIGPIAAEVGAWVEDKGATLSIHLREAPDVELARAVLVERAVPVLTAAGLRWRFGRMTLEAQPPISADKGTAIAALLADYPVVERSLYAGDDLTDLDGFRAADVAIAVQSNEAPEELLAAADLVVNGVEGLATLLMEL